MGDLPAQFNQEQMVSSLKHRLEGWRELLLPLHSVLLWQNPWHTAILFEGIFFIFLVIWWCDLSLISLFAIIGAIITSIDYIGPIAIRTISDPSQWNNKKEKNFEDICKSVVSAQITWSHLLQRIHDLKTNQPLLVLFTNLLTLSFLSMAMVKINIWMQYYLGAVISLLTLAFLGQVIDNLLLTYLLVNILLLIPGMRHNNPLKSYLPSIFGSNENPSGKKGKNKVN